MKKSEQIKKRLEEARKKVEDLTKQRETLLKQKTELLVAGESADAVSKKIRVLDCEALQKQSNLIYKEYMAVTGKIQEKEREHKQHTGEQQLWYVCSWAPMSPPAPVGALQILAMAEMPMLQNLDPQVSETQPKASPPPLRDTTTWRFRVKTPGVMIGGHVRPEGSIVSLPKHVGDNMKQSLEPLGPARL